MNAHTTIMALALTIASAYGENISAAANDLEAASVVALKDMEENYG